MAARRSPRPGGILLAGAGVSAGDPRRAARSPPPPASAPLAWAARVAFAVPRDPTEPHIDAGRLHEPWRGFVREALQAQQPVRPRAAPARRPGPLHDRLAEIDERIAAGVQECWRVAQAGHDLIDRPAPRSTPPTSPASAGQSTRPRPRSPAARPAGTLEALDAQLAAVGRMDRVIADTADRLRLLDARLDEAVTRAIELSVRADDPDELSGLGDDIDSLVDDMESLRQGLDEVDATVRGRTRVPTPPSRPPHDRAPAPQTLTPQPPTRHPAPSPRRPPAARHRPRRGAPMSDPGHPSGDANPTPGCPTTPRSTAPSG